MLGQIRIPLNNWTWYVSGIPITRGLHKKMKSGISVFVDRAAKITPKAYQQPKNINSSSPAILNDTLAASFYLYDHLGNTRVVYYPEVQCPTFVTYTIENATDYYPYGKTLRQFITTPPEKFLTTQHERDQETGLDYRGARFYDADIARFNSLDPLAANYPSLSDYSYVAANPVVFVDPTGMSTEPAGRGGNEKTYQGRRLSTVTIHGESSFSDSFNQLGEHQKNFLLHKWRMMEEGNLYKRLLGDAIRQGASQEYYMGFMDQSGWWNRDAQEAWQKGHIGWRKDGAGASMMNIATVGIGVPLVSVGGGSIVGSMATPIAASSPTISVSATYASASDVALYGYISGETAVSSTVTHMSRWWLGRMALTGGSLYTGVNFYNLRTGNYTPKMGLTSAPTQKSIVKWPMLSAGNNRYYDGFYRGSFRFQMHSHRVNGSEQYIPHINFGKQGKYHIMLNDYGVKMFGRIYKQ